MRAVGPMDKEADHRVFDGPELGNRFVRLRYEAIDQLRFATQPLERSLQLIRRLSRLGPSPFIRLRPIIARPENDDFFHGDSVPWSRRRYHRGGSALNEH